MYRCLIVTGDICCRVLGKFERKEKKPTFEHHAMPQKKRQG